MSSPITLPLSCIVCRSHNILPIFETSPLPIDTNRIWSSRAGAAAAPKASINLVYCDMCGHIFNRSYDEDLVNYEMDYENSQMFSPRFRKYCEELSDQLITSHGLPLRHVVEIGGGKGDFLRIICDRANNLGVSFDPSYRPEPGDDISTNIRFVTDYYTAKYAEEPADLIICRHVLEHCWDPRDLIMTVREAVGERRGLLVYFEVPNGDFILREQAFWELHYQHCSYFTTSSLAKLFMDCGFEVREIQENFGGQYLGIQAYAAVADSVAASPNCRGHKQAGTAILDRVSFDTAFRARVAYWRDNVERLAANGQRVVAWGAGAKAVTFLSIVDPVGIISHVVDVNPRKTGRFMPGSGREIIAAGALQELRPDVILVMNGIYKDEIGSAVRALDLDPVLFVV